MNSATSHAGVNRYRRAFQGSYLGAIQHWRLLLAAGIVGFTALSAYEFVAGDAGWVKTRKIEGETGRIAAENISLERQVRDLKEQERLLSSDDSVLEKVVREKLRLSRPGEILYLFEENPANSASTDPVTVAKRPPPKKPEETTN